MTSVFYLVSKDSNKNQEVEIFRKLNPNINIDLVYFEDIIPIAQNNAGKIVTVNGPLDFPDYVLVRAFDLGDRQYHLKAVLEMLESNNVVCINPAETKEKTSDKLLTNQIVSRIVKSVRVPKTMLLTPEVSADLVVETLGLPVVVKVMHGSGGKGLSLIKSKDDLGNLLNMLFASPFDDEVIAQEAITSSKGRDLRLVICNGEVIDSFVRENPDDFKSNVSTGGTITHFDTPEVLVEDALEIADRLGLVMGSIDFLFGENEDEFYFCEANSTMGFSFLMDLDYKEDKDILMKYSKIATELFKEL